MQLTNRQIFQNHLALPSIVTDPLEIVSAEGIYLYTDNNERYTDLVSGVSVSNIGHSNPQVIEAVKKQAESYMHLMVYGKYIQSPQVQLTKALTDLLPPSLDSVYLVNSGSEAVEGAIKLAKRITGKSDIVALKNAYHGSTHGALSVLGCEEMKYAYRPLLPGIKFGEFNNPKTLDMITTNTACIIMEPVQSEAGIIIPDIQWLKNVRDRCNETGTMLIFDEIQMGIGRAGSVFAFQKLGVTPDIICLAKALGAGMPIGAFISSSQNMFTLTNNPVLGHITTFGGHPVSAAAAVAGLKVLIDNDLPEKANKRGKQMAQALADNNAIKEIRQIGLMLGVELHEQWDVPALIKIFQKNKLIVDQFLFNDKSFRIAPPLIITPEQIDETAQTIIMSIDELKSR